MNDEINREEGTMSELPENWAEMLDAAVLENTGVEVETIWDICAGSFGAMVTTPKDQETPLPNKVHAFIRTYMGGMKAAQ